MGIIEHGFVTKFNKVGIIGYPNPTKRAPSMQHLIENSSKWALSEPNSGPNLTKWTLSGLKSNHVKIIGGGSCPRVDLVWKVGILRGKGDDFQKKWSYCVGVVRVDVTTPTPYGYFFQQCVPLQHHMVTFVEWYRFLTYYRKVKMAIWCGSVDKIQGVKWAIGSLAGRTSR